MVVKCDRFLRYSRAPLNHDYNLIGVSLTKPGAVLGASVQATIGARPFDVGLNCVEFSNPFQAFLSNRCRAVLCNIIQFAPFGSVGAPRDRVSVSTPPDTGRGRAIAPRGAVKP
jgi:hypothetical protein